MHSLIYNYHNILMSFKIIILPKKLIILASNWLSLKCKCRLSVIRCTFKTGISFNFHHMCFIKLSGSQSGIKMIDLIIPAAVRKGYKRCATCRILACDSLLAWTPSLRLQTRRNDTVPCSNPPQSPVHFIHALHTQIP